jgi:DNA-dependent metalloprotease WSS1
MRYVREVYLYLYLTSSVQLTHNVHGPHNQEFYKYLSGLEDEWEVLKRSGYSGEGFHSAGRRVGVGISHNLPMHAGRTKAVEAAEKRAKQQRLLGGPGRTLGGRKDSKSPRELAAEVILNVVCELMVF